MSNKEVCYHIPVMLNECMEGLAIKPDGVYVDVTFGGGGHSREILSRLGKKGTLMALIRMRMPKITFRKTTVLFLCAVISVTCPTSCVSMARPK